MVFGLVLAGGVGSRMGNREKPKQFLMLCDKPVIIHTLEKFSSYGGFEKILVLCPSKWILYTEEILKVYMGEARENIVVLEGGSSRNETIMNGIRYIDEKYRVDDETIVVTHDAARPFINNRIIDENIEFTQRNGAATTAVSATDTILYCPSGEMVEKITDRSVLYQCQTPQTFFAKNLRDMYEALGEKEREVLTDASGILVKNGIKVALVRGETYNIKITYPNDLIVAEAYIKSGIV